MIYKSRVMKQVKALFFIFAPALCFSQSDSIFFEKICAMCPGFPDSTIAVKRVNSSKTDTTSIFKIELLNYYTYWSFFDESNRVYIFIGVSDFGEANPNGSQRISYQMIVYATGDNTFELISKQDFNDVDYINFRLSFGFSEGNLVVRRGNKDCATIDIRKILDAGFQMVIPKHQECF